MRLAILGALGAGLFLAMRTEEAGPGSDTPRGIRNNNPGNLENNGIPWQGLAESQTDSRFYQFTDPVWGIRALARTLKTYRENYGLTTAKDIISRWAPAHENDTESYARAVAGALGTDPYTYISDSPDTRMKLVKAIIKHENGIQPYPDDLIEEGIARAYT
ncbi:structural protein [Marinobacter alkaliphilus]|uniref:Structural protein n=1 Tax=Marinobacter alkaliphilus TaxID=254719 RepID=A0ABZ3E9D4_9GAMM